MATVRFIILALSIHQLISTGFTLPFVGSKQYRIDRYSIYNCDRSKQRNEYVIFNKGTMKMFGSRDKLTYDGYFEILKDINVEVMIKGYLSRCYESNPTDCEYKRRDFPLPTVCSRSDFNDEYQATNILHESVRKLVKDILKILHPPIVCPVIKKNKYFLNYSMDMTLANVIPLEGSRWTTTFEFTLGGPSPKPLICLDTEMTVRRASRRN